MKNIFLIVLIITSTKASHVYGQQKVSAAAYHTLEVGEPVPDYTLNNIINYSSPSVSLSSFKGKLLILDFWTTWCSWCVSTMPKMHELQKEFGSDIQIIMVNKNQAESVWGNFISKREKIANVKTTLPIVYSDSILSNVLFKSVGVPHVVWIDKNGIVRNFSNTAQVTAKNIRSLLNNETVVMSDSPELDEKINKLFSPDQTPDDLNEVLWQSRLTKEISGLSYAYKVKSNLHARSFIAISSFSVIDLFAYAYGKVFTYDNPEYNYIESLFTSRVMIEASDSVKQKMKQRFTYQLIAPPATSEEQLQLSMRNDLSQYFGLSASMQKRKVKCLVLSATDTSALSWKEGKHYLKISDTEWTVNDMTIQGLLTQMEELIPYGVQYLPHYPLIDETGFKGRLRKIQFETNIHDHVAIDKELQKYGLRLKLEERMLDMLIIHPSGKSL